MGSRSASGSWEGHAELQQALEGLACAKGTSANRVKAVATTALRYAKVRTPAAPMTHLQRLHVTDGMAVCIGLQARGV